MKWHTNSLTFLLGLPLLITAQVQIGSDLNGQVDGDQFGKRVVMASNGNVLGVINYGGSDLVHIYENIGGDWSQYGIDSEGGQFSGILAYDLDFSDDGKTLAIGTKVFTLESGIWLQKGGDIPNNVFDSFLGERVCLSSNGSVIALSAPSYSGGSYSSRYVPPPVNFGLQQVFKYESGNWNQLGYDITGNHNEHSGHSLGLSDDGNVLAIANRSSVRIYEYISGSWLLKGNEILGYGWEDKDVSLSSDGTIVAIGEPEFSDGLTQRGRATVYKFESNSWIQVGNNIVGESEQEFAGKSVSLSSLGNVLAVSFTGNNTNGNNSGQVRIYKNIMETWIQIGNNLNGVSANDQFGFSLSLSSDATTVAVGAPYNDYNGTDAGQVNIFDLGTTLSSNGFETQEFKLMPNPTTSQFTIQVASGEELLKTSVYNNLGQLMLSTYDNLIKTTRWAKGIYYVEVETNKGKSTKKLVIK